MTLSLLFLANSFAGALLILLAMRLDPVQPIPVSIFNASPGLPEGAAPPCGEWSLAKLYLRKRELLASIAALADCEATFGLRRQLIRDLQPVCHAIAQRENTLNQTDLPSAFFP